MDTNNFRFCKKCLTRDLIDKDDFFKTIKELVDVIPDSVRTVEKEYERRLGICTGCEKLYDGMCAACGCYVELRAAKTNNACPYDRW